MTEAAVQERPAVARNGYIAFYGDQRIEIYAATQYDAYLQAVERFHPTKTKRHLVHVHLAEIDGEPYVHIAVD